MEVGFALVSCQVTAGDRRTWGNLYREALDLAESADRLGLDSIWTTEHHFVDDGYMPSQLVTCAAIAARTRRIAVGTGVLLAPLYDPLHLAEDAATVDLISGGRLTLGLGLGWSEVEFAAFGADRRRRGRTMSEILQFLPRAWSGEPVGEGPGVRPTPGRKIPIWVGGNADAAIRRAARHADGFLSNAPAAALPRQVAIFADERAAVGRAGDPFTWAHYAVVYLADDPVRAWEQVRPYVHHMRWKYGDMEASAFRPVGPVPPPPPLDAATEQRLRSATLAGPAEMVAQAVLATQEAAGVPLHFVARSYFPGMPFSQQAEQVHRLAEELKPLLA